LKIFSATKKTARRDHEKEKKGDQQRTWRINSIFLLFLGQKSFERFEVGFLELALRRYTCVRQE
jgi:hypothetical protein